MNNESATARFLAKTERAESGCLEWIGARRPSGYGVFSVGGKSVAAHRHAYTIVNGEIPNGLMICHRCDNRACVEPSHLYAGTAADNANDCVARGRTGARGCKPSRGETAAKAIVVRVTADELERYRATLEPGETLAGVIREHLTELNRS